MAADLRVLLWNPDASPFGGHVVQIEMTVQFLTRIDGISVRVCRDESPDWRSVNLVHGLGLERKHVREARRRGIPVCLSVIYLSKAYRSGLLAQGSLRQAFSRRARMAGVLSLAAARGRHFAKSEAIAQFVIHETALYEAADLLLPNSQMEANDIVRELAVTTPMRVVPNAADPALFSPGLPWDQRAGVLYVGRLEPHKNQLRLIEALQGTGVPLTIVGPDHPHHPRYANAVRAAASDTVQVLGSRTHDELAHLYARTRVHAVPSTFETTGLVSLEAALCGCNVVTTDVGYAREYFEDLAWYCTPYDIQGIRSAVLAAESSPPQRLLRQRILERYTWEHAAAATAAAYRDLVDHRI
jgi:glycosyltransferase involved in cell wall biosynthesis